MGSGALLPPEPSPLERVGILLADHVGLVALGLAALLGGMLLAMGWQRGSGE